MLSKEAINKMDADELRNYLYHLQNYVRTVRKINSARKESEDTLICLLRQREDLSILAQRENNQIDRLLRLTVELEHKYLLAYQNYECEDKTFKTESEEKCAEEE